LVTWESYKLSSRPMYTKTPPQTGGYSHFFFIKKLLEITFFDKENLKAIIPRRFLRDKCRLTIFLLCHFEL
jgi:hypothetical protein